MPRSPAHNARKENAMTNHNASENQIAPPPVPSDIQVPAGNKAFLVGKGVGTQNYICLPSGSGFRFVLFTPQATLFEDKTKQSSPTTSAPTRLRITRFAPHGSTRGTRARSGAR